MLGFVEFVDIEATQFNAHPKIQAFQDENNAADDFMDAFKGAYSTEKNCRCQGLRV